MEEKTLTDESRINKGPRIGVRHVQMLLMALIGFLMYYTRFGFSVSLVAMTNKYSPNPDVPYYNWTNKSFILSTFFWGYVIPQIPVGILGTKFGMKNFLLLALLINSLCMVVIPSVAERFGSEGVMACRIIQGIGQGLVVPCLHGIIGKWALPNERCRVYGYMSTGYILGTVAGAGANGYICASWIGWPLTFYLIPSLGFVLAFFYYMYGATCPATHKTISEEERTYIESKLKSQNIYNVPIPYRDIFTSKPFLAQLTMALCSGWGYSIFTTEMPIYMDKVMKLNIESNGLVSSLPSVFVLLTINVATHLADLLVKRNYLSITNTRKLMSATGSLGCAGLLFLFVTIPTDSELFCVLTLALAYGFRSFNCGGYSTNHLDLAPNFSAALMGIINTSSEIFSSITPLSIHYIVYDESDKSLWRIVFIIAVVLYVFSTCVYLVFASGEAQPWNYTPVRQNADATPTDRTTDSEQEKSQLV
ncbi:unnamed protein product [Phyllotreta striolata]|uniref:Major facilitator superfamily (MFS) profile domain-containing protein n=1 Tax=Phyllotreta striolata TaxID=444603 RepID=A0A9N9XR98_PHYSR|nr:unnamed protein product [Phyllotreta striolata]